MAAPATKVLWLAALAGVYAKQVDKPPTLAYWHNYVAADGKAYFAQCNFSNFSTSSIGPGVVPSWHEALALGELKSKVAVFPVGHVAPWHVDPVVQIIQVSQ
jgi:hypothetical protein